MRGHTSVALPIDFRFAASATQLLEQGIDHEERCVRRLLAMGAASGSYRVLWPKDLSESQKLQCDSHAFKDDADFLLFLFEMNDNELASSTFGVRKRELIDMKEDYDEAVDKVGSEAKSVSALSSRIARRLCWCSWR